jgi:hypothetical protein
MGERALNRLRRASRDSNAPDNSKAYHIRSPGTLHPPNVAGTPKRWRMRAISASRVWR